MKAYEVIDTPEKWCKGHVAVNAEGIPLDVYSKNATAFCIYGALHIAYLGQKYDGPGYNEHAKRIRQEIAPQTISQFNDNPRRTHEEVISLLKRLDI